jgi:hypothetical protein
MRKDHKGHKDREMTFVVSVNLSVLRTELENSLHNMRPIGR